MDGPYIKFYALVYSHKKRYGRLGQNRSPILRKFGKRPSDFCSSNLNVVKINIHSGNLYSAHYIRGHPFMTSARRGSDSGGRMWAARGGPAPCGRPHRKLKLESTDVILSSSHANKLSFFTRISSLDRKNWKFVCDINYE